MAKEQDIYTIIEQQNEEEKNQNLQKLYTRLSKENIDILISDNVAIAKKVSKRTINILIISFAVILALSGILLFLLLPDKIDNTIRYCTAENYYITEAEQSIREYAVQSNKAILSFDWIDGAERMMSQQFTLNDTNELIGLYEEGIDNNGAIIYFYVVKKNIELDLLSNYNLICTEIKNINSVDVLYTTSISGAYAMFKFGDYSYFLQMEDMPEQDYIFSAINDLLLVNQ